MVVVIDIKTSGRVTGSLIYTRNILARSLIRSLKISEIKKGRDINDSVMTGAVVSPSGPFIIKNVTSKSASECTASASGKRNCYAFIMCTRKVVLLAHLAKGRTEQNSGTNTITSVLQGEDKLPNIYKYHTSTFTSACWRHGQAITWEDSTQNVLNPRTLRVFSCFLNSSITQHFVLLFQ